MKQTYSHRNIRSTKSVRLFFKAYFDQCNKKINITDTESFSKYKDACQRSESKKVFHSAYHAVDSGFQLLDSSIHQ